MRHEKLPRAWQYRGCGGGVGPKWSHVESPSRFSARLGPTWPPKVVPKRVAKHARGMTFVPRLFLGSEVTFS